MSSEATSSFSDLGLNSCIVRQCTVMGLKQPTPIQVNCIPQILAGKNCIGSAQTGSGKTLAFALPILHRLCEDLYGIYALVLTPTRELAFQIAEQFAVIGKVMNLKLCVVTGGMDMMIQGQELARKPHIVIATPGRLADHLESCNTFSLEKVKFLVFDEADRLLGGCFDEQLATISAALPKTRQNLLFSATITDALEKVKQVVSNKVFFWEQKADTATVEQLAQFCVVSTFRTKESYLVEILRDYYEKHERGSIIIFTDTCKNCQLLSMTLTELGFENAALHSMIRQKERLASLSRFKSSVVRILIATDVASRGLDIPAVELVINHTLPNVPKDYIHRVGRTARAGRNGMSISIVTPDDLELLNTIEKHIKTSLKIYTVEDDAVAKILTQVMVTRREAELILEETNFFERKHINTKKRLILEGKEQEEREIKKRVKKLKKQNVETLKPDTDNAQFCK